MRKFMGRIVLQMMISLDGIVQDLEGKLDWIIEDDEKLNQDHLKRLEEAEVLIMGANMYPGLPDYWEAAAKDEKERDAFRAIGRAMNKVNKDVYSHKQMPVTGKAKLHLI